MEMMTSTKKIILFLIGLNIATILTSVAICSSPNFVANANPLNSHATASPPFDSKGYVGTISDSGNLLMANLSMTFEGTPTSLKVTKVSVTAVPTGGKNSPYPFDIKDAKYVEGNNLSEFDIQVLDRRFHDQPTQIHFHGTLNGNVISGNFDTTVGARSVTQVYSGFWSVTGASPPFDSKGYVGTMTDTSNLLMTNFSITFDGIPTSFKVTKVSIKGVTPGGKNSPYPLEVKDAKYESGRALSDFTILVLDQRFHDRPTHVHFAGNFNVSDHNKIGGTFDITAGPNVVSNGFWNIAGQ